MKYKDFVKYITKVNNNQIEQYVENDPYDYEEIYGKRTKKFVRFSSDIESFQYLISELQENPNCKYETYVNELIKEGYIPEFISVIIKDENDNVTRNDDFKIGHLREPIACRIVNYFGCPTTYDMLVDIDGEFKSCSVDFNKENEDLYNMGVLKPLSGPVKWNLDDATFYFRWKMENFLQKNGIDDKDDLIKTNLEHEYVYNYLVRKIVLADGDYGFHNVGLIHDTKNNVVRLSPNFDYEYTFRFFVFKSKRVQLEALKYVSKHYPQVFTKFVEKFNDFMNNKAYRDIIRSVMGKGRKSQRFIAEYEEYLNSIKEIVTYVQSLKTL